MKRVLLALALLGLGAGLAAAEYSADLTDGVFIAHHPSNMSFSTPAIGWCAGYAPFAITSCDQQVNMLSGGVPGTDDTRAWFVLAQWWLDPAQPQIEGKEWCATEFGIGAYDPNIYTFMAWGACTPDPLGFLEINTGAWPGPNAGTIVTTTTLPWQGNFVPTYYFAGYQYAGTGVIPLAADPTPNPFIGMFNCETPSQAYPMDPLEDCIPAMGIGIPGVPCCAEEVVPTYACCFGEECRVLTADECLAGGGVLTAYADCDLPNPCVIRACCVEELCQLVNERECLAAGGNFLSETLICEENTCITEFACCVCDVCTMTTEQGCADIQGQWFPGDNCDEPTPCGPPSPTDNTSWGNIKAIYR